MFDGISDDDCCGEILLMSGEMFSRAKKLGYNIEQVEKFLAQAKNQYLDPTLQIFDVAGLRGTRFDLQKNGYLISAVDSAIEKLEDVFAERELERELVREGYGEFIQQTNSLKELLLARVRRTKGKKFDRRRWPSQGYSKKQVDQSCSQLATHLEGTLLVSAKDVRLSVFKTKRGGYAEHQVDAFIDKFVELIQRENILRQSSR